MDWRTGYFRQALSDYEMFVILETLPNISICHRLHYLQMATEKLAKGFQTPSGAGPFDYTHKVFKDFVTLAIGNTQIRTQMGMAGHYTSYERLLKETIKPLADSIQNLSPEGEDHPNPEYPWHGPGGTVLSPLDYSFAELSSRDNPKMQKLRDFLEACFSVASREIR